MTPRDGQKGQPLAVVIDEQERWRVIATVKDLVEEIVGRQRLRGEASRARRGARTDAACYARQHAYGGGGLLA